MNQVIDTILRRRSVRRFLPDPVPEDALHALLEAANAAPSAHNRQAWRFIVIRGETKDRLTMLVRDSASRMPRKTRVLMRLASQIIQGAPLVVAIFKTGELMHEIGGDGTAEVDEFFHLMEIQSASAAVQNLMLAATSLGLGTVWLGAVCLIRDEISRLLGQPGEVMALVPVGWPAGETGAGPRKKPWSEVTVF